MQSDKEMVYIPTLKEFKKGIEEWNKREQRGPIYKVTRYLVTRLWGEPADMAEALDVLLSIWNQAFYRYGPLNLDILERCIADNMGRLEHFKERNISSLSAQDKEKIRDLFEEFLRALQIDYLKFTDENKKRDTLEDFIKVLESLGVPYERGSLRLVYDSIKDSPELGSALGYIDKRSSDSKKNYITVTVSELSAEQEETFRTSGLLKRSPVSVSKALHSLAPSFFPLWEDEIAKEYSCKYGNEPVKAYLSFSRKMKEIAERLEGQNAKDEIDERCLKIKFKSSFSEEKSMLKLIDEFNYSKYTKQWV